MVTPQRQRDTPCGVWTMVSRATVSTARSEENSAVIPVAPARSLVKSLLLNFAHENIGICANCLADTHEFSDV
jgi:hypothetical protein